MGELIALTRPRQWIKNLFVALPLFFNGGITRLSDCLTAIAAVFVFTCAAAAVYCVNDIADAESDAMSATKRHRPIAAGAVSSRAACALSVVLAIFAVIGAMFINTKCAIVIVAYLTINVAYSISLKQVLFVDVAIVAFGFVLRLMMGGYATDVKLSSWIVIMTSLLAVFLVLAKRRSDSSSLYSDAFTKWALIILAVTTILIYGAYTFDPSIPAGKSGHLIALTIVPVTAGLLRYLRLALTGHNVDPMHVILHDRFIEGCIIVWVGLFGYFLYY